MGWRGWILVAKLYLGDCLEILPTLPEQSVDAIITDLPYGTTRCKWDVIIPLAPMWEQVNRICKSAFVTTASQPFTSILISSNVKRFKYEWIWDKVTARGHLVAKYRPMAQHENIVVFKCGKINYVPQMIDRPPEKVEYRKVTEYTRTEIMGGKRGSAPENKTYDRWFPKTIISISNAGSSVLSLHPTQKPVPLYEYLVKTYTNEGDTVLDFCMGSGTTGVACINTNRNFVGIEKDPKYFEIAKQRISESEKVTV